MTSIDDMRKNFSDKLDQQISKHEDRLKQEEEQLSRIFSSFTLNEGKKIFKPQGSAAGTGIPQFLVNITESDQLKALDKHFMESFNISSHFSPDMFSYPTKICTSLEEFFSTFFLDKNVSQESKNTEIKRYVDDFMNQYRSGGSIIWGVNFPGQGCYINGWLIAQIYKIQPDEIADHKAAFQKVLDIATHEKLGHGFLSVFSSFGQLGTKLGLNLVQIASQFGLTPTDDAGSQLQYKLQKIHFNVSKFLEEGWSTWIENYLQEVKDQKDKDPQKKFERMVNAFSRLPYDDHEKSKQAITILFGEDKVELDDILAAVQFLAEIDNKYYDQFGDLIGQPLRYVLGELLCEKVRINLGVGCVPYAALIAANVSYDPDKMGVSDLKDLLTNDPRCYPDVRLAAISRLQLDTPGSIEELSKKATSTFSFSVPVEIR